jgi:FkbM family methyltransferase
MNFKKIFTRKLNLLESLSHSSFSQEGEDMILRDLFHDKQKGFFIDVGAFHPTRFSNTSHFYEKGWKGINIEPSPDAQVQFAKIRPLDINLNIGISDEAGELIYYVFDEPALNTFDPKRVEYLHSNTNYKCKNEIKISVRPLKDVLDQYLIANQKIDFMNIDVEWQEIEVLKSNDWNKYRPKILLIEILNFDLETIHTNPIHIFLKDHGYHFFCKTPRTCFYEAS